MGCCRFGRHSTPSNPSKVLHLFKHLAKSFKLFVFLNCLNSYYLHNGQHYGYHQCPYQYLEAMDNVVDSRDYYYSADIVPRHPLENGDDVKRLLADYSFNDIEGRTGIGSGTEDIRIPNYRLFHFVLRLVRTMRRHFLPLYATHPDDISNIYAQYNEHELRRRNA